jgi:DNA polymerase-2
MARFNISPETVNCPCCPDAPRVPELGYHVCRRRQGITSRVVAGLISKRIELKRRQKAAPADRASCYKVQREAYTGYKNARFGKIEAHEAINAVARETLLVAKETAEAQGFELLHALVDSLYIRRNGATPEDYERLAQEIEVRTRLPLAVEAVYCYVVFLPSRQFADVPVPNVRGLESRRHDTPPLVARMQREALAILAEARDFASYREKLNDAGMVLARYLECVESGAVDIAELVMWNTSSPTQKRVSRMIACARTPCGKAGGDMTAASMPSCCAWPLSRS